MKNNDYVKLGLMEDNGVHVSWASCNQAISDIRKQHGLSQTAIAKELNYSVSQVSRIETGQVEPPLDFIQKFCVMFKVNVKWLLFGEGPAREYYNSDPSSLKLFSTDSLTEELKIRKIALEKYSKSIKLHIDNLEREDSKFVFSLYLKKLNAVFEKALPLDAPEWLKEDLKKYFLNEKV